MQYNKLRTGPDQVVSVLGESLSERYETIQQNINLLGTMISY